MWAPLAAVALLTRAATPAPSWQNQESVSMCNWAQFRANVIRDTVYLDGGSLWWQAHFSDGRNDTRSDDAVQSFLYTFNLGKSFNQSSNFSSLLGNISKTGGLASNNIAPNFVDGVMFANDGQLLLYGGLTRRTDSADPPDADEVLAYEAFQYGPERASWKPGFVRKTLPDDVTRYITNGAGVSAPSENLGFYFSGMRAEDWGLIQNGDHSANRTANTLITVDMSEMRHESWTNNTLPPDILGRANAELVWVPVSDRGVLVAIGGVINPESVISSRGLTEAQETESNRTSPTFMETVAVYDIANEQWFLQNTTGDIPPQLTLFCSTVAVASDKSSYNIYIYGGYDGISPLHTPSDDVYVLSLPSFTWIKVYSGRSSHGRSGHKCVKPYPDQMMVLGGIYEGNPTHCLEGGLFQVFNLNTLRFQDSYDPREWEEYSVPDLVTAQIGGDARGGATKTAPSRWSDDDLASVFRTEYTKEIPTYYPYDAENSNDTDPSVPSIITVQPSADGGLPAWAGAVIGVLVGLAVIGAAVVFFLLWRRRKARRESYVSDSTQERGIMRWLSKTPSHVDRVARTHTEVTSTQGNTETDPYERDTSETIVSPSSPSPPPVMRNSFPQELDSNIAHELPANDSDMSSYGAGVQRDSTRHSRSDSVQSQQYQHHQHRPSDVSNTLSEVSDIYEVPATRQRRISELEGSSRATSPEQQGPVSPPISPPLVSPVRPMIDPVPESDEPGHDGGRSDEKNHES